MIGAGVLVGGWQIELWNGRGREMVVGGRNN